MMLCNQCGSKLVKSVSIIDGICSECREKIEAKLKEKKINNA